MLTPTSLPFPSPGLLTKYTPYVPFSSFASLYALVRSPSVLMALNLFMVRVPTIYEYYYRFPDAQPDYDPASSDAGFATYQVSNASI